MLARVDIKYFKLAVGANLGRETDVDISARCPVCGDSSKKKSLKRLHLYNKGTVTGVNCFNGDCPCHNKTVYSFLRDFFPDLLPQYKRETFSTNIDRIKNSIGPSEQQSLKDLITECNTEVLPPLHMHKPVVTQDLSMYFKELQEEQLAIDYLDDRKILHSKTFGKWYFGTQDLKIGETTYNITDNIIIPLYFQTDMYGFYSRSITGKSFVTYMNDANIGYKIWNWFNVDFDSKVYIFEGIFDAISSGKKNIVALLGAKLPTERLAQLHNPVFVLDNDRTGILNMIEYAKQGHNVFVQPKEYFEKDMNELMKNIPDLDICKLIDDNTFTGISAITRLKQKL